MKKINKLFALICALALLASLASCKADKKHTYAEFNLTVPENFFEYETDLYDLSLTDGVASLGLNRISFVTAQQTGLDITLTPTDFATYYMRGLDENAEIHRTGDVPYAVTVSGDLEARYFCLYAFYRTPQSYFTLVCMAPYNERGNYEKAFIDYIDNVEISRENS